MSMTLRRVGHDLSTKHRQLSKRWVDVLTQDFFFYFGIQSLFKSCFHSVQDWPPWKIAKSLCAPAFSFVERG